MFIQYPRHNPRVKQSLYEQKQTKKRGEPRAFPFASSTLRVPASTRHSRIDPAESTPLSFHGSRP